jgi:hypothetical protein
MVTMKTYVLIPFAVLLGLVLGGWGPRSELKTIKQDLKETRRLLKEGGKQQGAGTDMANMSRLLGIGADDARDKTQADMSTPSTGATDDAANEQPEATGGDLPEDAATLADTADTAPREATDPEERSARGMEQEIDRAMELWKLRSDIARSTFLANGEFSDEEAMHFDVLMEAMNIRLGHTIETWATAVENKQDVGAEEGVRLMNGVTDALVVTYDEMDRKLPGDWRETGGKDLRLFDFIDPAVAKPMIRVEGRMGDISNAMNESDLE